MIDLMIIVLLVILTYYILKHSLRSMNNNNNNESTTDVLPSLGLSGEETIPPQNGIRASNRTEVIYYTIPDRCRTRINCDWYHHQRPDSNNRLTEWEYESEPESNLEQFDTEHWDSE